MDENAGEQIDRLAATGGDLAMPASRLAVQLRRLPPKQLGQALRIPPEAITLWELLVGFASIIIDDSANASIEAQLLRAGQLIEEVFADSNEAVDALERLVQHLNLLQEDRGQQMITQFKRQGYRLFLKKLVGPAEYAQIESAFRTDAAVVMVALRRANRALMPFAVAFEDLAGELSPGQIESLSPLKLPEKTLLSLVVEIDRLFDRAHVHGFPIDEFTTREEDRRPLATSEARDFVDELRNVITAQTRKVLIELNQTLNRKLQGARDALAYSADPVSQASNSLIELIDRLLREAFTEEEVLAWVNKNYSEGRDLFWYDHDRERTRPTKKAQALCFTYAGVDIAQRSPLHELAATGVVVVRAHLQKLKHADHGTPQEQADAARYLSLVEAYLTVAIRNGLGNSIDRQHDSPTRSVEWRKQQRRLVECLSRIV